MTLPVLTPDTWGEYKADHLGPTLRQWYLQLAEAALRGERDDDRNRRPRHEDAAGGPRFRSAADALGLWVAVREGSLSPRRGMAYDEPLVQTSVGLLRDNRAQLIIDDVVAVERALLLAYRGELEPGTAIAALCLRLVGVPPELSYRRKREYTDKRGRLRTKLDCVITPAGYRVPVAAVDVAEVLGIPEPDVGRLVRTGKGGLEVDLGARGLLPLPRKGTARRLEALRRRAAIRPSPPTRESTTFSEGS